MIPKVIHYCWFGKKPKSKLILDCIQSWRQHLPDYEIKEWNETNSDLSHPFVKEAYALKKWAFVADFIRLKVLLVNGGIYLDTDMMIIKSLNSLLLNDCFFGVEDKYLISAGIIGAQKNNDFIKRCLSKYEFIKINAGTDLNQIAIPIIITQVYRDLFNFQLLFDKNQNSGGLSIYSVSYFYPLPNKKKYDIKNYKRYIDSFTYAVHLWNASWVEYDEFDYLKNKQYLKAVFKVLKSIFYKNKMNIEYFKKVLRHILYSFKKDKKL